MTVTFNWFIDSLETLPSVDGQQAVVSKVNWRIVGTEFIDGYTRHNSFFGATPIPYDPAAPFTDYAALTQEQVLDWVKSIVGPARVAAYEAHIAETLQSMAPAAAFTTPLPWA